MHRAVLISTESTRDAEVNLLKIAQFAGLELERVSVAEARVDAKLAHCDAWITSAEAFRKIFRNDCSRAQETSELRLPKHLFVFGVAATAAEGDGLGVLNAPVSAAQNVSLKGAGIAVSRDFPELCRELSGLSFDCKRDARQQVFSSFTSGVYRPLVSIAGMPAVVVGKTDGSTVMLVAGSEFVDLDSVAERETRSIDLLSQFMPFLTFLRHACPGSIWEADHIGGCFIVDDPPLKSRYGSLDLDAILRFGRSRRFAFSIAFIPWNFRRSERNVVERFKAQPGQFSICVHGCDHTWGEFQSNDQAILAEKTAQALNRMAEHRRRTGLEFDDVFVFPQGLFSKSAMTVLKKSGCLAAINSTGYPADYERDLTVRDLLDVAITAFGDFPLFTRRYPNELIELAFDVYLGRPALLVEHHRFFEAGDAFARVIDEVEGIVPKLRWSNPAKVCETACVRKADSDGNMVVKFFTPRFAMTNESQEARKFTLIKELHSTEDIKSVLVNGQVSVAPARGEDLRVELLLKPGERTTVDVQYERCPIPVRPRFQPVHAAKVLLRRTLAELSANYLHSKSVGSESIPAEGVSN